MATLAATGTWSIVEAAALPSKRKREPSDDETSVTESRRSIASRRTRCSTASRRTRFSQRSRRSRLRRVNAVAVTVAPNDSESDEEDWAFDSVFDKPLLSHATWRMFIVLYDIIGSYRVCDKKNAFRAFASEGGMNSDSDEDEEETCGTTGGISNRKLQRCARCDCLQPRGIHVTHDTLYVPHAITGGEFTWRYNMTAACEGVQRARRNGIPVLGTGDAESAKPAPSRVAPANSAPRDAGNDVGAAATVTEAATASVAAVSPQKPAATKRKRDRATRYREEQGGGPRIIRR